MNQRPNPKVLATDLDGTLIPMKDRPENIADLERLKTFIEQHELEIVFVTGRPFESVVGAIKDYDLPATNWIICDVGTSIYSRTDSGDYQLVESYSDHLGQIVASMEQSELRQRLEAIEGLRVQEPDKLGRFKLSYYTDASQLNVLIPDLEKRLEQWAAPWSIVGSVDPFNGDGLIDFLPREVSKAHALLWWAKFTKHAPQSIIFAGDSGNDIAALISGFKSIVVGNASPEVVAATRRAHQAAGWKDRLFVAGEQATSGVLEGCRQYWE